MRARLIVCLTAVVLTAGSGLLGQSAAPQRPLFRSNQNLILVDVSVRDKKGQPIDGLTAADFEVLENGKTQEVVTFAYEKVAPAKATIVTASTLSKAGAGKGAVPVTIGSAKPAPGKPAAAPAVNPTPDLPAAATIDASATPLTSDEVAGHRVWILLFDTSSMQPEDVQKAADAALKWSNEKMSTSDLVAIAAISSTLQILTDFTNDKAKITATLKAFAITDGTAVGAVDASTMSSDEATATSTTDVTTVDTSTQELDSFNNDMRLRGLKTICDSLVSIQQHKAILYFSSGMARNGSDNAVESRAAVNACSRANTSINPIDSRGLQVVVAGGSARQGSRGGVGAFSGRGVAQQFAQMASQQETLQSLASDTGGQAFTDSNDFGEAFAAVEKDISSYYILGYSSTNAKQDGSFRKIEVKLKSKIDAKLSSREGYYADRDFANTGKGDRENALQEQLLMPIPATDVPLFVTASYFRLPTADACGNQVDFGGRGGGMGPGGGRGGGPGGQGGPGGGRGGFTPSCYYVPISVAVPGEAVPLSSTNEVMDVRGFIRDERGQTFATIKSTINVPPATKDALANKQVLFQTGATLPPGRYTAKIIVRENTTGQMGTFETAVVVPDLSRATVKMSTVVLSTQLLNATGRKTLSPLVHDNIEIVPNLTRVVNQDQKLYFYYEVYDPTMSEAAPQVRTNLAFYRNKAKVYETPIVERTSLDALDRKAEIFEFVVDAGTFKPGVYTCQVNVVDAVSGAITFQRFQMAVRPSAKIEK
ncbi:MAG: VWA domain-containing protein [Acidobacteriota bacterium]